MNKGDNVYFDGVVEEVLPNLTFRVRLTNNVLVIGYLCGKMRKCYIKIMKGDRVMIEMSPYDKTKGRIVRRHDFLESSNVDIKK